MFLPFHDRNPILYIRFPTVNYALIACTCVIFGVQSLLPPAQFDAVVLNFGMTPAVLTDLVPKSLPWLPDEASLVTYAFVHASWMHLLSNMLFLWIFGDNIEDALGHWRYVLFYVLCAVFAALAYLAFNPAANGPLIGASGAVAGVMGAYVLLYPHARVFVLARIIIPIPLPIPAFWMLGFWFATQLFYALLGSSEPIAWWAHVGGLVAGLVLGLVMRRRSVPLFGGR